VLLLMLVFGAPFRPSLLSLPWTAVCTAMFALGIGLIIAAVSGYFADAADLFQVILGTWIYLTPVIYPASILPARYQWVLRLNPMTWFVDAFRAPIYAGALPSPDDRLLTFVFGAATFAVGWWVFTRVADDLVRRG
jgi:ABC-type polysaccharide/polyol phosphate export permease